MKRKLTDKIVANIEAEVKIMLHASRDCLRNRFKNDSSRHDPKLIRFDLNDGYYGEAFGIMRTLRVLGYGNFGAANTPCERTNLKWWFLDLEQQVLDEEGFGTTNHCKYCHEKYGKG